jgi:hypothetical protein
MCCLRWGERQLGLRDKPFRESIPHPIRPLPTLRTARYRDARRAGRGSRERRNGVLGEVFGSTVEHNDVLARLPWCGVRADRRSPMRIDSAASSRFDFAAVGARQPASRARVLEVRIQSPPGESRTKGCRRNPPLGQRGGPLVMPRRDAETRRRALAFVGQPCAGLN